VTRIGGTGHRSLPPDTARLVADALHQRLAKYAGSDLVGISSLADGADQLFARAVLAHGGALHVIVPARQYRGGLPKEVHEEYDALMSQAQTVERLPFEESTEEAHMAAGRAMVSQSDLLMAVWDGQAARGFGGTADVVAHARQLGVPVEVVWPDGASRD
jgi:hypothetical protein